MDYVVFGIGFGATILVLGLLVRDIGPRLRYRKPAAPDGVFHAEELVARVSWSRFCGALGSVLAIAGALFLIITFVCMLLAVSDGAAGWVMGISLLVLVLLVALWTWMFFDRFGSFGILPEREEEGTAAASPRSVTGPAAAHPDSGHAPGNGAVRSGASGLSVTASEPAEESGDASREKEDDVSAARESDDERARPDVSEEEHVSATPPAPEDIQPETPEQRRQTPEERLANVESPIEHGSAEGELDIPISGHRRPSRQNPSLPESVGEDASPETAEDADSKSFESGDHTEPDPEV